MFHLSSQELGEKEALITAEEILQQPELWDELYQKISSDDELIRQFLDQLTHKEGPIRVIFTGAGSSAYVGNTVTPIINKLTNHNKFSFESIPTTDIVADPESYLEENKTTLLVSFARSGNSPESATTIDLVNQIVHSCFFITITCNPFGQLAQKANRDDRHLLLIMPEKSNDKGFAMTSSFTCMLYSAVLIFGPKRFKNISSHQMLEQTVKSFIKAIDMIVPQIDQCTFNRIIFLGSSALGNLAREASLKFLELNAGKVGSYFESSMGFRHGPKSLLSNDTLIVLFSSSDLYTRSYDIDIAKEIKRDCPASQLVVLCSQSERQLYSVADHLLAFDINNDIYDSDFLRSLIFIIFAQMFALHHSLAHGITPDNPSPDGKVNRVVKGVHIYEFK